MIFAPKSLIFTIHHNYTTKPNFNLLGQYDTLITV